MDAATVGEAEVVTKWTAMMTAIVKHEHEHAQFGREAADALVKLMRNDENDASCPVLEARLKSEGQKILDRQSANDRDLDIRTQHGALEGVAISW